MGLNVPLGIQHLQLLGVRYFLASSTTVEAAAAADPNLTQVASTGPWSTSYNGESLDTTWKVYEIRDSSLVKPLADRPVVWTGVKPGPDQLVEARGHLVRRPGPVERGARRRRPGRLDPGAGRGHQRPTAVPEPATTVSDIAQTDSSVSFHVDRVGTPVEVKVSVLPQLAGQRGRRARGGWRPT